MLIIKRKKGQRVFIGEAVLTVLGIDKGIIKLGFEAPQEVIIRREELPVTFKTKKGSDK